MRVLYLINGLGAGGAERSLAEMLPLLPRHGVDPMVAALYRRREGVQAAVVASGVPVFFLDGASWIDRVRRLRGLLGQQQPDILHTTIFEADVIGRLAAACGRTQVVGSLVNTSYGPERRADPAVPAARLEAARRIDSWTARHLARRFHALTAGVKQHAVAALRIPPDRIVTVPRGRDSTRLGTASAARRQSVRERLGLGPDHEVILNVGRQEYQKDHRTLLAAFTCLARSRGRAVLLQAGREGSQTAALRDQAAAAGLGDRVRFLGHREDVPDLMAASDAFVFPSRFEGMGGSVIEAMALRLPVVASDLPVLREVVDPGRSALLVPVAAPDRLAEGIARVLDEPELARTMADRGESLFRERYELGSTTAQLVGSLYGGLR